MYSITLLTSITKQTDEKLFQSILSVLAPLLPDETSQHCHLRPRHHLRQHINKTSKLFDCNFIERFLYKHCFFSFIWTLILSCTLLCDKLFCETWWWWWWWWECMWESVIKPVRTAQTNWSAKKYDHITPLLCDCTSLPNCYTSVNMDRLLMLSRFKRHLKSKLICTDSSVLSWVIWGTSVTVEFGGPFLLLFVFYKGC